MSFANKYPGICVLCGGEVGKGEGIWLRGKVYHQEGDCGEDARPDFSKVKPDRYQQAIIDSILLGAGGNHILVDAKAGSGKTTIGCMGLTQLYEAQPDLTLAAFAFGSEDGKRLRKSLPQGIEARTHHSLCMGIVRSAYRAKHRQGKVNELLEIVVGSADCYEYMREHVRSLLAIVQADAVAPGDLKGMKETLHSECYDLGIPEGEEERVIEFTDKVLDLSLDVKTYGFTFDDALYLCAIRDLSLPHVDVIFVDEIQDWNNCQLIILQKMIALGARVVAVGDPNQSLYGFRGAQPDAFERVHNMLSSSGRTVERLPMPVCRRSARAIVDHAAKIVSDIQALDDAPEGELRFSIPVHTMLDQLVPGDDMVLSRTNARLVRLKYICIRLGIPAYMLKGSQEAGYLCWLVDMLATKYGPKTEDVGELMNRAQGWLGERCSRTSAYRAEEHRQRIEVLSLVCEQVLSVEELKTEIYRLFAPPSKGQKTVILSTIHRAKGSEARRIWNISPDLLPHPRAKGELQLAQERNAQYVAITRAIDAYYETSGDLAAA